MLANKQKIILCATNSELAAGIWYGNRLQSYESFQNVDEGHTAFSEYLARHRNINVSLIVDAVEEDYKLESLPHTSGAARRELVERKLNQFNRSSQFRTAHFIKRSSDKRKDDNFLFVALTNADFLQGWLNALQANQAPLVGVYLLPMLSQTIVRQMKLMAPHILFCEQLPSGLRQTYLHNGRLRMSRLVPMKDVKDHQRAYFYLTEIEKTRLYLLSQRLIANETGLQLVLPSTNPGVGEIAKSISQDQGMECKVVDILAFAKNIGTMPDQVKEHPDLLHMQLLANGNVPDNFAPADLTKTYNINNIRRSINFASVAVGVLGAALAAYYVWHGSQQKKQIAALVSQTQQQEQLYLEVAKNFPITPIPSTDLKVAVDLAQNIQQHSHTPRQMMQVLSVALEESPEIVPTRIRWVQSANLDIKDDVGQDALQPNQNADSGNAELTKLWQIGFVTAEIKNFNGDYRAALASVNQLVSRLRQDIAVEQVTVLQEPVNVSSLANLQGSTTDETTAERTPAAFKIKIVLKQAKIEPQISAGGVL